MNYYNIPKPQFNRRTECGFHQTLVGKTVRIYSNSNQYYYYSVDMIHSWILYLLDLKPVRPFEVDALR